MNKEQVVSVDLNTGKEYIIPSNLDDQLNIDLFLDKNRNKQVVVVQGLGFVGAVMSLVCANAINSDYAVIGVDLPMKHTYWKIKSINSGVFPIVASDKNIDKFYNNAMKNENLLATFDPYAYSKADIIIVDINLDVQKKSSELKDLEGYDVDMSGFEKAMKSIGSHCKEKVLILVETTVPPGTTLKIVKPIIEKELEKRGLAINKFYLGHSYERVMPGPNYIDSIQNFWRVYSGVDERSANATELFLRTIISTDKYPLTRLGNTNATEMAKVMENSYRAMNIAFMVEWSRFAEEAGVNVYEVVNAIRMRPTHKNIMLPGIGVGGYCLTKDPLLASWSKQNLFGSAQKLGQSEKGVMINDKMPQYAFEFLVKEFKNDLLGKNVLLLGVSYLNDVGDTRYTPVELFYNLLIKNGAKVRLHDPHVRYWEEKDLQIEENLNDMFTFDYNIIVISTGHKEYRGNELLLKSILNQKSLLILDTIGVLTEVEIIELSKKHKVRVLGRGDIK